METKAVLDLLANSYLYGWAGAAVFFILFILALRQATGKSSELNVLKREKRELQESLSEKEARVSDLESRVEDLKMELDNKTSRVSELESQLSSLEENLKNCQSKVDTLEEQVRQYKEENSKQAETIRDLDFQLSSAKDEIAKYEKELEEKRSEVAALAGKVEELEGMLQEARSDLNLALLYIKLKDLHGEFDTQFTQNILKGINTMNITDIDLRTAQTIFEQALKSFNQAGPPQVSEGEVEEDEADSEEMEE